jgi:dihydroorotate dehydrogenase (NAD+) catalytic subunit
VYVTKALCSSERRYSVVDLSVSLGPIGLEYPLINASGTMELLDLAESVDLPVLEHPPVAAYVPKTVTQSARLGNPPPRILEVPGGLLNAIGLPSGGMEAFVSTELPRLLDLPCPLIVSIGGFSAGEYVSLARGLRQALERDAGEAWKSRVGLELNISCPNVHSGCVAIGSDPVETEGVVSAVRGSWPGLLVAKLTPNVTDVVDIGRAAERAGADAVAAVNTFKGLALDRRTLRPYLGNVTGGLSGPVIKPLALRCVYELFAGVGIPIIGMGGVTNVQDVLEFMACGASVVAIGSSGFQEPGLASMMIEELRTSLVERRLSLHELVGCAHRVS